jgi:hypothetical protein
MKTNRPHSYAPDYYSPLPTRATRFWRNFIPWQIMRFIVINYKIIKIVVKWHLVK